MVRQFNVHVVNLEPTIGAEMKKERRCLVISPFAMNDALNTVLIAPMTTTLRGYPSRVELRFEHKFCEICLDQIRCVDGSRIAKESRGRISKESIEKVKVSLNEMLDF